jgi:hypothetical protein
MDIAQSPGVDIAQSPGVDIAQEPWHSAATGRDFSKLPAKERLLP